MCGKILILNSNPPKAYVDAVLSVGLIPDCRFRKADTEDYAGLLLTGGGDVAPFIYGKQVDCKNVNIVRDEVELAVLKIFMTAHVPILGVCRGMQLINVALGGTIRCVSDHIGKSDVYHDITGKGFCKDLTFVNSAHRQAIDSLADGFSVEAVSSDGVIEAIKRENVTAVQFHPERLDRRAIKAVYGEFAKDVSLYLRKV